MIMGLGFVLSFGYWCTDFLVVQRAMVAKNMSDAERTPIAASIAKMALPFIVILPGLIAVALSQAGSLHHLDLPLNAAGQIDYNMTLPTLLAKFFPSGLLGVGLTALIASFMSGMAGNVTAFNSVWTFDIYQPYFKKNASDGHYLMVARIATVAGVLISIATAYLARSFNNIMDLLQLVFGFVNAPLFATFLLGMFWKRTTAHGAFTGLISGTVAAAIVHGTTLAEGQGGWLLSQPLHEYRSSMGQAFSIAIASWTTCFVITFVVSLFTKPKADKEMVGLVWSLTDKPHDPSMRWFEKPAVWAVGVLAVVVALNVIWF
jgi:SSS family solute:Na+ symporter